MLLKDYLKINDIKIYEVAEDLGVTKEYISRICHGHHRPSKALQTLINYYTENEVGFNDWEEKQE